MVVPAAELAEADVAAARDDPNARLGLLARLYDTGGAGDHRLP